MIICGHCESASFLQIIRSEMHFDEGEITKLEEDYQCTLCESRGEYVYEETGETGYHTLRGEIEEIDARPKAEI